MKCLFASILLLFSCLSILAQNTCSISGRVVGIDHSAISNATVLLYRASDTSLVRTNLTKLDGAFSFDKLEPGTYQLKASHAGFESFLSKTIKTVEDQDLTIQSAILVEQAEELDEKEVRKRKRGIKV